MICIVIPVVIMICVLLLCKWSDFSIIPENLRLPKPRKFKLPSVKRNYRNEWENASDSESESSSSSGEEEDDESESSSDED